MYPIHIEIPINPDEDYIKMTVVCSTCSMTNMSVFHVFHRNFERRSLLWPRGGVAASFEGKAASVVLLGLTWFDQQTWGENVIDSGYNDLTATSTEQ